MPYDETVKMYCKDKKSVLKKYKSLCQNYAKSSWKHRDYNHLSFKDYLYYTVFLVRFVKDICLYIIVLANL